MRASGRVQLAIWRARSELHKSTLLRRLVNLARGIGGDSRERHLRDEVRFWRRWMASEGLIWRDDFWPRFSADTPVQDYVARVIDVISKSRVDVLDVGAGPVTVLGKTHPSKQVSITATDPLAREYNLALEHFALNPPVRTIYAEAEDLRSQLGERQYDIVHAQNSLDHCRDPFAGLEEMLAMTRPGGFIILLHEENEGRNEMYHALHKWDLFCENGQFFIAGPGRGGARRNVSQMLTGRADVECSMYGEEVLIIMHKQPHLQSPISERASK